MAGLEAQQIYIADGDEYAGTGPCDGYEYTIEWSAGTAELRFFPQPPVDTEVIHRYTRVESLLNMDTDTPLMPERYHSIIIHFFPELHRYILLPRMKSTDSGIYDIACGEKGCGAVIHCRLMPPILS